MACFRLASALAAAWAVAPSTLCVVHAANSLPGQAQRQVVVASKAFTESVLLGEIMAQVLEAHTNLAVKRRLGLGGTMICWQA